jgi:hypothetical protein
MKFEMKEVIVRIKNIYKELIAEDCGLVILGTNEVERDQLYKVNSIMWLAAFNEKNDIEEADRFVKTIIVMNSEMIKTGIINLNAEIKHVDGVNEYRK